MSDKPGGAQTEMRALREENEALHKLIGTYIKLIAEYKDIAQRAIKIALDAKAQGTKEVKNGTRLN